ncbi:unnamed protein product [Trichobilharzia regenti]|nr:unnamed protein product [Trichobilharzia regenti]
MIHQKGVVNNPNTASTLTSTNMIQSSVLPFSRTELEILRREIIIELRREVQLAKNEILDCKF